MGTVTPRRKLEDLFRVRGRDNVFKSCVLKTFLPLARAATRGKSAKTAILHGFFKIEWGSDGVAATSAVVWLSCLPKIYHGGPASSWSYPWFECIALILSIFDQLLYTCHYNLWLVYFKRVMIASVWYPCLQFHYSIQLLLVSFLITKYVPLCANVIKVRPLISPREIKSWFLYNL